MSDQKPFKTELSPLDRWGIVISSICLVHCAGLSIVFALLPALSSALPPDSWVHPILFGLAMPVTGVALWRGYRRHRRGVPTLVGVFGLGLIGLGLIAAALFESGTWAEPLLTVAGGLLASVLGPRPPTKDSDLHA